MCTVFILRNLSDMQVKENSDRCILSKAIYKWKLLTPTWTLPYKSIIHHYHYPHMLLPMSTRETLSNWQVPRNPLDFNRTFRIRTIPEFTWHQAVILKECLQLHFTWTKSRSSFPSPVSPPLPVSWDSPPFLQPPVEPPQMQKSCTQTQDAQDFQTLLNLGCQEKQAF